MKQTIRDLVSRPFFKQLLKEWSLHLKTDQDPTWFANMYLELMRDPVDHEARMAVAMFAAFMKVREWPDMMETIEPTLDPDVAESFRGHAAPAFFDGFRDIVIEQIRAYWEESIAAGKAKFEELGPRDWSPRTGKCLCQKS